MEWQAGDSGKSCNLNLSPQAVSGISLAQRRLFFVLLKPATDWIRPSHIANGNLLYSEFTELNVNPIQMNTFTETSKIVIKQTFGHYGQARLTNKINHSR